MARSSEAEPGVSHDGASGGRLLAAAHLEGSRGRAPAVHFSSRKLRTRGRRCPAEKDGLKTCESGEGKGSVARLRELLDVWRHELGFEGAREGPADVAGGVAHVGPHRRGAARHVVVQRAEQPRQHFRKTRREQQAAPAQRRAWAWGFRKIRRYPLVARRRRQSGELKTRARACVFERTAHTRRHRRTCKRICACTCACTCACAGMCAATDRLGDVDKARKRAPGKLGESEAAAVPRAGGLLGSEQIEHLKSTIDEMRDA
eukprot:2576737-Pleurochrysis_carterae.AAC.2